MTKTRDQIIDEINKSVPRLNIIAAAVFLMAKERGLTDIEMSNTHISSDEIWEWCHGLDASELIKLRRMAELLEEERVN
jgi:hypothetical protein